MDYMERALSLARLALGSVSPNPAVGAVIVKDDSIVGEGYTQPPGSDHAEIVALKQAGEKSRGATMCVTLEPCCHYGRTPPCTQAIISSGIAEVRMAILDPNPLVSGKGRDELERAGLKTGLGEHEDEARRLNEAYIKFITMGLPFVTAKFAMSLDGKIATRDGDSKWITGEKAREAGQQLRRTADAVMVGVNTVICDDPRLTVRNEEGKPWGRQPVRVIVDTQARTPPTAQLLREPGKTIVATTSGALRIRADRLCQVGAEVVMLPINDWKVDLKALLQELATGGITSVVVEGGSTLFGSLFDQGLVDKVVVFVAPVIIGGAQAKTAVGGAGVAKMAQTLRLSHVSTGQFGDDMMVSGYVRG